MKTTSVPLIELFEFPSIKGGMTEAFIKKHPGSIPVYGGRIAETPIGFIADNLDNVKYFEKCIGWNREGSVGYVFYHNHRFTTNDHHRPMVLRKEYEKWIDLDYISIVLQQFLLSQGFQWSKTASKEKVKEMSIEIPVDKNGEYDINQQAAYVRKYRIIQDVQQTLNDYLNKLRSSVVALEKDYKTVTLYLSESYFNLSIGNRVLKKDVLKKGIPLYSANPKSIFGYVASSNYPNFDRDSLIWGIDGNFQWNFIPKNTPFATTDHCGRLQILNDNIISEYVFYQLRESSGAYGFDRTFRASLQNIKGVSIEIPVNESGEFDVQKQKELIQRYISIDSTTNRIIQLIEDAIIPQVEL